MGDRNIERSLLARAILYARTIRHLRPRQLAYFVFRQLVPVSPPARPHQVRDRASLRRPRLAVLEPLEPAGRLAGRFEFRFLNETKRYRPGEVDWACPDMSRLWRFSLHAFEWVLDRRCPSADAGELIRDWIARNPPGPTDAWNPFVVSLRIVSWIKLFSRPDAAPAVETAWLASLYQQALWLERNIEYHILANHYIKNGKALFFSGAFFEGIDADRWLAKGLRILREEADEQILSDGAHFERSLMYHSVVVEDYLDVLNAMRTTAGLADDAILEYLGSKVVRALDFLSDVAMPDGEIPLFNDAAFGIAPAPRCLFDYGARIVGYRKKAAPACPSATSKEASGYYVMRCGDDMLVLDCGEIGPSYQPGHAHADTLSYELALDGHRAIVDSGVHDYLEGPARNYARSTRAHNTVAVDGADQTEVWRVFRVARRARPILATLTALDGNLRFVGAHDGYRRLPGKVIHQRTLERARTGVWTVRDELLGSGVHRMQSFVHLHPRLRAVCNGRQIRLEAANGACEAVIDVADQVEVHVARGSYSPEFGLSFENDVITLTCSGALPLTIAYTIEKGGSSRR